MNVLVLVPDLSKGGGVANYYRVLEDRLAPEASYLQRGSGPGRSGHGSPARLLREYRTFWKRLRQEPRPSLVHINTSFARAGLLRDAGFILLSRLAGRRVMIFLRGWDPRFERGARQVKYRAALRLFLGADRLLVLASEFRDRLREWGCDAPIEIETTVVDQTILDGISDADVQERFRDDARLTVLFLARVERSKGVFQAIDAHAALAERHPGLHLRVAGDGGALEEARSYVTDRGIPRVEFLGYVRGAEKLRALKEADLYVLPTEHGEGMPNSLLEAMACGIPAIVRPVGGIRDFFVDGEMGYQTEGTDAADFAPLIERLIVDGEQRRRMSLHVRAYALERFSAGVVAARLKALWAKTLQP